MSPWWCNPPGPLTAGEYVVSGSVSSPLRGAFHLSLTVLVRYRSLKVLCLGGWSPLLPTNSPGFVVLRNLTTRSRRLATGLSPPVVPLSNGFASVLLACMCQALQPPGLLAEAEVWALPASLATTTGISFDDFWSSY
jgi:hypothetical protein